MISPMLFISLSAIRDIRQDSTLDVRDIALILLWSILRWKMNLSQVLSVTVFPMLRLKQQETEIGCAVQCLKIWDGICIVFGLRSGTGIPRLRAISLLNLLIKPLPTAIKG